MQPDARTLERASLSMGQTGTGSASGGRSAGASGLSRALRSGSKKHKLDAASGYVSFHPFLVFRQLVPRVLTPSPLGSA